MSQSGKRIMLIDDESINNFISTKIIERSCGDFNVVAYTRAREALQHLESGDLPDFIFLDINMPEMDGWDFLEQYSTLPFSGAGTCKVVMLTSSMNVKDIQRSRSYAFVTRFISKPLTVEAVNELTTADKSSSKDHEGCKAPCSSGDQKR